MKKCRAKTLSESGTEHCQRKSGHKGWHSYTCQWRGKKAVCKVLWRKP